MKLFTLLLALMASGQLIAQSSLKVTITNVRTLEGKIHVVLHKSGEGFPDEDEFKSLDVSATSSEVSVTFENISPGDYALSVAHDINENGELDKNIMGIPKEPFGFSNDEMGMFGPPRFKDCIVNVPENETATTSITLKEM